MCSKHLQRRHRWCCAAATSATHGELNGEQSTHLDEVAPVALNSLATQHKLTLNTLVQGTWALLWLNVIVQKVIVGKRANIWIRSTLCANVAETGRIRAGWCYYLETLNKESF